MCEECKSRICHPSCRHYPQKLIERRGIRCVSCGELLQSGGHCYRMHGFPYCEDCLDFADTETLIRICEMSKRQWLERLGFVYAEIEGGTEVL